MTVVNKYVVSGRHFDMNFLLLATQASVCVMGVTALKKLEILSYKKFTQDDVCKWLPISMLLVAVIYTGSKSLHLVIPVYTVFKNLAIIIIAYGEMLWFGGAVTPLTLLSFILMIVSSLLAAWADSHQGSFSAPPMISTFRYGYLWMLANVFASAAYVLCMRKRIKVTHFKVLISVCLAYLPVSDAIEDVDVLFLNNAISVPILLALSVLMEDWSSEGFQRNFPSEGRHAFIVAILLSGVTAIAISYTTFWCLRATSSTTYSMVGALNKLPVAASGIIFFGDPATGGSILAILIGGMAGIVYAVAKRSPPER